MTNRERLRGLTDEGLAEELWNYFMKLYKLDVCDGTCAGLIVDWLETETGELNDPIVFRETWSARTMNCLYRANIRTFAELIEKTPDELMNIRCFGKTCLLEVREELGKRGLMLKGDYYRNR